MGGVTTAGARELRKSPTQAEGVLWKHPRYRQLGGYKFRRQAPIGSYIADFMSLEKRLIIELDGGHHPDQAAYDSERTTWLQSQGFCVLRFWNNQVLQDIEGVKEAILKALEVSRCPPPSQPSPARGEGVKVPSPTFLHQGGKGKVPCTSLPPQVGKWRKRP